MLKRNELLTDLNIIQKPFFLFEWQTTFLYLLYHLQVQLQLQNLGDIKKSDITTLGQLIGGKIAKNLLEQCGIKVDFIPKKKRVGQLSLNGF